MMKHLYTITFDSDYSSDDEETPPNVPAKPQQSPKTFQRIRPIPRSIPIKVTTRNLSEESKQQQAQPTIDINASFKHKKKNRHKRPRAESNDSENYSNYYSDQEKERSIPIKNDSYDYYSDYDYEKEEAGNTSHGKNTNVSFTPHPNRTGIKSQESFKPKNHRQTSHQNIARPHTEIDKIQNNNTLHNNENPRSSKRSLANSRSPGDSITNNTTDLLSNDNSNKKQNTATQVDNSLSIPSNILYESQEHENNNFTKISSEKPISVPLNNTSVNVMNTAINQNDNPLLSDLLSNMNNTNISVGNGFPAQLETPYHFSIIRQGKSKNIFSRKASFAFMYNDHKCYYEAKPEKGSQVIINILKSTNYDEINSQIKNDVYNTANEQVGVVICSPEMDFFSLRLNNQYGCEIMSVRVNSKKCKNASNSSFLERSGHSPPTGNELNPNFDLNGILRLLKVFLYESSNGKEKKLQNMESFGLTLDFGDRDVLQSTKNFLLMDSFQREFVAVRKTEKNCLCVDFQPVITPFCAFAIGLIAFLYKA